MNRLMTQNSRMKAFFVTLMLIPSLHGMAVELTEEAPSILRQLERDGATPLHIAAYCDRVEGIEKLIAEGASIDAKNAKGATPLHFAAKRGNILAVQSLIAHKAGINVADNLGFSPLYYATRERKLEVIRYLLENGAAITKANKPFTPLHVAAFNGDLAAIECMFQIKGTEHCMKALDGCWNSPLHCAAENGSRAVIDFLIQSGELVSVRDKDGNTPLLIAARHGNLDALRCLLDHGASLNEENEFVVQGRYDCIFAGNQPPIMWAFLNGHVKAVEVLLTEGAKLDRVANCMAHAAKSGSVAMLKVLLKHGAGINEPDYLSCTALHYAAEFGQVEATKFLLGQGARIEVKNGRRANALHEAVHNGHVKVIKELLASGADIEAVNLYSPLQWAAKEGHPEVMRFLISNGANLRVKPVLFAFALTDHPSGRNKECFKVLLEAGLPVDKSDVELMCRKKSFAIARMLIKAHPECIADMLSYCKRSYVAFKVPQVVHDAAKDYFNKRTSYVYEKCVQCGDNPDTVFEVAAYFLDWQVLKIFKDQWREKLRSWRDAEGKNLLMGALEMLDREALGWFLEEKICDINDVDSEGHDALWLAIGLGNALLINDILSGGAQVRGDHLWIAGLTNYEIAAKLALLHRYSICPDDRKPAGLNLFR